MAREVEEEGNGRVEALLDAKEKVELLGKVGEGVADSEALA